MNVNDPGSSEPPRVEPPPAAPSDGGVLQPKRIYRDPSGPVGGVAGGFAGYFDIDPVIARLLWIVALFSGIGFPAYLVCWLIIPKAKVWPAPGYGRTPARSGGQSNTTLLSGFVIIALVAVVGTGVDGVGHYLLPAALIGFGVYLLSQRGSSPSATPLGAPAVDAVPDALDAAPLARRTASSVEAPSSERAGLVTPTVLSVLAIVVGVIGTLHAADLIPLSIGAIAAGGLLIVGAGLLSSLWLGRARGLVPLGLGLVAVMLGAATLEHWHAGDPSGVERAAALLHGGQLVDAAGVTSALGNRSFTPESLDELEPSYDLGAGNLSVDLSHLDFSGQTRDLEIDVGMGDIRVIVPVNTAVEVEGSVGVGEVTTFGRTDKGMGIEVKNHDDGASAGHLNIELNVGVGKVEVLRDEL